VLIVGLVVLLVVSIFGITAMRSAALQERMAGNARQSHIALQAAEAGLQAGLTYLERQTRPPIPNETGDENVWTACGVVAPVATGGGAEEDAGQAKAKDKDKDKDEEPPVPVALDTACARFETVIDDWVKDPTTAIQGKAYTAFSGDGMTVEGLNGVLAQPRIYIESRYLPPLDAEAAAAGSGTHYYTVTAVGYGQSESAIAIVQSTIARIYQY
jgi:Tfp pilus assembly protein PilX